MYSLDSIHGGTLIDNLQEINTILGEKLSAEDEEDILAEFENLETQVCIFSYMSCSFFYS